MEDTTRHWFSERSRIGLFGVAALMLAAGGCWPYRGAEREIPSQVQYESSKCHIAGGPIG